MPRLWVLVSLCVVAALAHTHSHEPAAYKYSREANEAAAAEGAHDHYHSHDHGHSHDEYEHDAHEHGHSHEGGGCPYANQHGGDPHGYPGLEKYESLFRHAHDHGHSHGGADDHHGHSHEQPVKRDIHSDKTASPYTGSLSFMNDARTRLWVHAIGATLLISIAPFIILFAIPINSNTAESGPLLKVLLAFGSGGLLGDAFLHLIPHAAPAGGDGHGHSHSHSHSHGHSHGEGGHDMSVGGWVLGGIIGFLIVEKLVRILRGDDGHSHGHGHSHGGKAKSSDDEGEKEKKKGEKKGEKKKEAEESKQEIRVAAYLNLVADFAHNFTDGLAIGASFIAGSTIGFVTMVTVLVHEVPHEIGDFAILIQSGYTRRRAMMMQLVTAAGALSGCIISLWAADSSVADAAASSWILPFTAGGFIYIATVSVIPELLENSSLGQSLKEIAALLLGIFLMYLIAIYE